MRRTPLLLLGFAAALPLAACGDDDGDAGGSPATTSGDSGAVTVVAEPGLRFDAEGYDTAAGEVEFVYENADSIAHTLVIDGIDADEFRLEVGDSDDGSVTLEEGEYTVFCDVPGHRAAGMEATLTVTP